MIALAVLHSGLAIEGLKSFFIDLVVGVQFLRKDTVRNCQEG